LIHRILCGSVYLVEFTLLTLLIVCDTLCMMDKVCNDLSTKNNSLQLLFCCFVASPYLRGTGYSGLSPLSCGDMDAMRGIKFHRTFKSRHTTGSFLYKKTTYTISRDVLRRRLFLCTEDGRHDTGGV
jgi:hypothetical protein